MDSLDTNGELQVTGTVLDDSEQPVVATLEQLFTGLRVGMPSLEVQCSSCGIYLDEGDGVSVYAYRTAETPQWHLACCQCLDCESDDIQTPTRGTAEVRVRARLGLVSDVGTQQHQLCLIAPDVVAFEAPTTGTSP
jgi:hypothetical protein